jgi:hypothetical protein
LVSSLAIQRKIVVLGITMLFAYTFWLLPLSVSAAAATAKRQASTMAEYVKNEMNAQM